MPRPSDNVRNIARFRGLRDALPSREVGKDGFIEAVNVDVLGSQESDISHHELRVSRRKGFAVALATTVNALWSDGKTCLFTSAGSLKKFNEDETATTLQTGLTTTSTLAVARRGDRLYWSNGVETGVVDSGFARSLGIDAPTAPVVTSVGGHLPEGTYSFGMSYLRSDGQESGLSLLSYVTTTAADGFSLAIPASHSDSDVTGVRVYTSAPNGTQLYRLGDAKLGASAMKFDDSLRRLSVEAAAMYHVQPPDPFDLAAFYGARLVTAKGDVLFYSLPYSYELFDRRFGYVMFEDETPYFMFEVEGGFFVGTSKRIAFLRGDDIESAELITASEHKAIPKSKAVLLKGGETAGDNDVYLILTNRGFALCGDGGSFVHISEGEVAFPNAKLGTVGVRRTATDVLGTAVVKY